MNQFTLTNKFITLISTMVFLSACGKTNFTQDGSNADNIANVFPTDVLTLETFANSTRNVQEAAIFKYRKKCGILPMPMEASVASDPASVSGVGETLPAIHDDPIPYCVPICRIYIDPCYGYGTSSGGTTGGGTPISSANLETNSNSNLIYCPMTRLEPSQVVEGQVANTMNRMVPVAELSANSGEVNSAYIIEYFGPCKIEINPIKPPHPMPPQPMPLPPTPSPQPLPIGTLE